MKRLSLLLFLGFFSVALAAETPLTDPAQEARARTLFQQFRCVVCQSESVADSPAAVAKDMRGFIRAEIANGADDAAITQKLVASYGDFVLMRPPFKPATWALWLAPLALLAGGFVLARRLFKKQ